MTPGPLSMALVRRCSTETLYLLTVLLSTNVKRKSLLFSTFINNISAVTLVFNSSIYYSIETLRSRKPQESINPYGGTDYPCGLRNGVERSEVEEVGETGRKCQDFSGRG